MEAPVTEEKDICQWHDSIEPERGIPCKVTDCGHHIYMINMMNVDPFEKCPWCGKDIDRDE